MFVSRLTEFLTRRALQMRQDPLRNGQMLHLPAKGDLVVAGDLHNHQRNFQRVRSYADLGRHPNRIVILQEVIHGGALGPDGEDTSLDLLLEALRWGEEFPGQVHMLMANHDLAQVQHIAIMKDGYDLTERFTRSLRLRFGAEALKAEQAFHDLVYSMPLAAISVTGLFLSHSLPTVRDLASFDPAVLRRPLTEADYQRNGSIYQLIWGRNQTPEVLSRLSKTWWADVFVCGHQQQDAGYATVDPNMLIIDSCHNHGVLLHVDLGRPYTLRDLVGALVPLASVA